MTQPDPVTTPGPFGNVRILTLPGTFLVIPIGAIWLLAAPWATRAANALDRLLIRELLGPASLSQRVHELEQTRAYAVDDSAARLRGPVLDTGLDAALATLAARSTVPVDLNVDVPQRPPLAIETIAYYCTAERLANVAKHSSARHAAIEAVQLPGLLRLRVTDDGTGDARLNDGGGLGTSRLF